MSDDAPGAGGTGEAPAVLVENLASGYFGSRVLEDLSFAIREPAVYVVLGPNGAGKTTLFRTLAGILRPQAGRAEIRGLPSESRAARERIGYLTHIDGIPEGMRVREALSFYAGVEGAHEHAVDRVVDLLELQELGGKRFGELSQGQRKRISVARIFLREKDVYLLDEPTSNLDPKVAKEIRDLVLGLSQDRVVLYSSHNLYEAREIGNQVIAIKEGRLAVFGRIADIRTASYVVGVRTVDGAAVPGAKGHEGDYQLMQLDGPEAVPDLLAELVAKGIRIREVREMENPLEELFR